MIHLRLGPALVAIMVLASCGNMSVGGPSLTGMIKSLGARAASPPADAAALKASLTPAVLAKIDTPLLLLDIPARDAVAVLSKVAENQVIDTYLSADGRALYLRDGVIVGTRGFGFDLMTADVMQVHAAMESRARSAVRIHRTLDGENKTVITSYACHYDYTVARQVKESCRGTHERFENTYRFDESARILASHQWVSGQLGSFRLEMLNNAVSN